MHPSTPPCLDCGGATEQIHLPKAISWNAEPISVYRAPDGSMRFPGDANGLSAKSYRQQGFEEIQIRGAAEMRRFEGAMNKVEYARAQRKVEHQQRAREESSSRRASDIRHGMQQGFTVPDGHGGKMLIRLSERGRDIMREAQRTGDRRPKPSFSGANFHSEVFSFDRSNRDESRDSQGRKRRD